MTKRCRRCGDEIEEEWSYCPRCGNVLKVVSKGMNLNDLFSKLMSEMQRVEKDIDRGVSREFDKELGVLDLSPFFRSPRGRGFTIKITQGSSRQPNISIETFGNVDKDRIVSDVYQQMGMQRPQKPEKTAEKPAGGEGRSALMHFREKFIRIQEREEPRADVFKTDGRVVAEIELPGVKSGTDIEIRSLPNSVEVRAVADRKSYFKILTKPENSRLTGKRFQGGRLRLEFSGL